MKIENINDDEAVVKVNKFELLILSNALNEVCNGLDIVEFHARMGANHEEVLEVFADIKKIKKSMFDC